MRIRAQFVFTIFLIAFAGQYTGLQAQDSTGQSKFIGNVIAGSIPANYDRYWNQVTPENAGKWGSAERKRDAMSWSALDNAYRYAQKHKMPFKQHTFIWGQQQPEWLERLSPEDQKEEADEWIKSFCERYPETAYIDVVNEPLHAPPAYAGALGGPGMTGWDWVIWSFEKARAYCPNARLVLNDYNILSSDSATTVYVEIISLLQERGLIDIVGEQGHFLETTPTSTIERNLARLVATGLPVHISEYDVNLANDEAQRSKYKEQFPIFWENPAVRGVTLWGYREGQIWRDDAYLVRFDGSARPALIWLMEFIENSRKHGAR